MKPTLKNASVLRFQKNLFDIIPDYIVDNILIKYDAAVTGGFLRDKIRQEMPNDFDIILVTNSILSFISDNLFIYNLGEECLFTFNKLKDCCYTMKIPLIKFKNGYRHTINITIYENKYQGLTARNAVRDNFDFNVNMLCLEVDKDRKPNLYSAFPTENVNELVNSIENGVLKVNPSMTVWSVPRMITRLGKFIEQKRYTISQDELDLFSVFIKRYNRPE